MTKQRKAFLKYLRETKPVCETWTGWRRDLVLRLLSEQQDRLEKEYRANRN